MIGYNPRQECLAKLPVPWTFTVSSIGGGNAGAAKTFAGTNDVLVIQGENVGMAGNRVSADGGGFAAVLGPLPNCPPAKCVGVNISSQPNVTGVRSLILAAAHGHSEARVQFEIIAPSKESRVANIAPDMKLPGPPTTPARGLAAPFTHPAAFSPPVGVDHNPSKGTMIVKGKLTKADCRNYRGFPAPSCYDQHRGTDFLMAGGFQKMDSGSINVIAAAPGVVVETADGNADRCFFDPKSNDINCPDNPEQKANYVALRHDDGLIAYYFHLQKGSVAVRINDRVACGQALGRVGSSGNSSMPHLHFELRRLTSSGQPKNFAYESILDVSITVDPYAEKMWSSVDARNVPNGNCHTNVSVPFKPAR
jgi:murein DD-endopeptidase MepM/ murein hydrolase activator NlpD